MKSGLRPASPNGLKTSYLCFLTNVKSGCFSQQRQRGWQDAGYSAASSLSLSSAVLVLSASEENLFFFFFFQKKEPGAINNLKQEISVSTRAECPFLQAHPAIISLGQGFLKYCLNRQAHMLTIHTHPTPPSLFVSWS